MSWLCHDPGLGAHDWELLDFSWGKAQVFTISRQIGNREAQVHKSYPEAKEAKAKCRTAQYLENESGWDELFQEVPQSCGDCNASHINLVLAGRVSSTSSLSKLPFSRKTFANIKQRFSVHGSIVRTINRNASCAFSQISFDWKSNDSVTPSLVYNCRTPDSWDEDAALSITFFPGSLTTNAVWYGCNFNKRKIHGYKLEDYEIITSRLVNSDCAVFHPMLLPTIFADQERERQIPMVRNHLNQLVERLFILAQTESQSRGSNPIKDARTVRTSARRPNWQQSILRAIKALFRDHSLRLSLSDQSAEEKEPSPSPTLQKEQESSVILWLKISDLRNGLENWKTQLSKMLNHVRELDDTYFNIDTHTPEGDKLKLESLRKTGGHIRERLQDLINEYDEFIRDCALTMDGLTLATQLELNQIGRGDALTNQQISSTNLEVASRARRDGYVMKSIAVLGMIFLPGTFVSSFFSMGLFRWIQENDQRTVSPFIWVYFGTTLALTSLTLIIFFICTSWKGRERGSAIDKYA